MSDRDRILFLIDRDSPQQVIDFAIQAKGQYRRAVLSFKKKYGRGGAYRRMYIDSYLFHKRFVRDNYPIKECVL